jgi:hypothetical protein
MAAMGAEDDRIIWEATHRLGLHGLADDELETLIRHAGSPERDVRLIAEAAHHVRELRLGLAKGDGF